MLVEKGSITVDGISLTVSALGRRTRWTGLMVSLIPTTREADHAGPGPHRDTG